MKFIYKHQLRLNIGKNLRTVRRWDRVPGEVLQSPFFGGFQDTTGQSPEQPGLKADPALSSTLD